jgi:ABC-type phosphate transport system permease subunit
VRKAIKNSSFAFGFYTACAIVAVWLPLAIAAVITVMWIYWVIYAMRTARESRSG